MQGNHVFLRGGHGNMSGEDIADIQNFTSMHAIRVEERVAQNREQPGAQLALQTKFPSVCPSFQKGILNQIFGPIVILTKSVGPQPKSRNLLNKHTSNRIGMAHKMKPMKRTPHNYRKSVIQRRDRVLGSTPREVFCRGSGSTRIPKACQLMKARLSAYVFRLNRRAQQALAAYWLAPFSGRLGIVR